jgi:DNA-binding FadR family transcriptional regulator
MEFREAFESRTVAYAVERATKSQISGLRESVDKLEAFLLAHGGGTEFYQMELNLHVELAKISGNPLFEWLATAFQQNAASYSETFSGFLEYISEDHSQRVIEDWRQLLDAMEKREALRATMIVTNHTYQFSNLIQDLSRSKGHSKSGSGEK